jgi:hypothetical protein
MIYFVQSIDLPYQAASLMPVADSRNVIKYFGGRRVRTLQWTLPVDSKLESSFLDSGCQPGHDVSSRPNRSLGSWLRLPFPGFSGHQRHGSGSELSDCCPTLGLADDRVQVKLRMSRCTIAR